MQCMKCGRDLEAGQVFCPECQENMAKYPVKPGTVVQLPYRSGESAAKKQQSRRKTVPLEEQVAAYKRVTKRLAWALLVSVVLSAVSCYVAIAQYVENKNKHALGQNYSVSQNVTVPATTTGPETAGE